jgi:hypothetical protein
MLCLKSRVVLAKPGQDVAGVPMRNLLRRATSGSSINFCWLGEELKGFCLTKLRHRQLFRTHSFWREMLVTGGRLSVSGFHYEVELLGLNQMVHAFDYKKETPCCLCFDRVLCGWVEELKGSCLIRSFGIAVGSNPTFR